MRTLKRCRCSVLSLVLERRWWALINSGVKLIEFRRGTPYWARRIENWLGRPGDLVLEFRCGYSRMAPRLHYLAGGKAVLALGSGAPVQHPEIGEFPGARFALLIGERVRLEGGPCL